MRNLAALDILADVPRKSFIARVTDRRGRIEYEVGYTAEDFDPEGDLPTPPPEVPPGYSATMITEYEPGTGPLGADLPEYWVTYEARPDRH